MNDYEIPIETVDPFFDFSIELSGKEYIIEIIWNNEEDFWTISLFTSDKTPIFLKRKIVANYDLFSFCSNPLLPDGQLLAIDTQNILTPIAYEDLGNRISLVYRI